MTSHTHSKDHRILERGRKLHLFEGLPRVWTRRGCVTELKAVPTTFGDMSLKRAIWVP